MRYLLHIIVAICCCWSGLAQAIDVVSMYRGSCRVDTGVILHIDARDIHFLGIDGNIAKIPRFEVIGLASYPLPYLPLLKVNTRGKYTIDFYRFETFRDGEVTILAEGWPIAFNSENIQVLTRDGSDYLLDRNAIWGVSRIPTPQDLMFRAGGRKAKIKYELRHPLAFETCPANLTPGSGIAKKVIPQMQLGDPISIKREHDDLRAGYEKLEDYQDRQRFYAIPQYYGNLTRLGTWLLLGARYSNIGARQINFLPLVQDEFSDGPFGFQRILKSGVAPILWSLHDEPVVQIFYGLKADYIHLDVFADPTAPLIGNRYSWEKDHLDAVDDRLIEKGGMEFGFDFGYFSTFFAFSSGVMAIRAEDDFVDNAFGNTRIGLSAQYNYYKLTAYYGTGGVELETDLEHDFRFLKILYQGPIGPDITTNVQFIQRSLVDEKNDKASFQYESSSRTVATEVIYDINYRWQVSILASLESLEGKATTSTGEDVTRSDAHPKLSSGVTVAF